MDIKLIENFLTEVAANNNRPWFQEHKAEYERAKKEFEGGVEAFIKELSTFDPEISSHAKGLLLSLLSRYPILSRQITLQASLRGIYLCTRQEVAAWRLLSPYPARSLPHRYRLLLASDEYPHRHAQ